MTQTSAGHCDTRFPGFSTRAPGPTGTRALEWGRRHPVRCDSSGRDVPVQDLVRKDAALDATKSTGSGAHRVAGGSPEFRSPRNPTGRIGVLGSDGIPLGSQDFRPPHAQLTAQFLRALRYDWSGRLLDTLATLPYGELGWVDRESRRVGRPLFQARGVFRPMATCCSLRTAARRRSGYIGESDSSRSSGRTFARPRSTATVWLGFAETGAFICSLSVPRTLQVFHFDASAVVAVYRDEMDVESIEVWSFTSPR